MIVVTTVDGALNGASAMTCSRTAILHPRAHVIFVTDRCSPLILRPQLCFTSLFGPIFRMLDNPTEARNIENK